MIDSKTQKGNWFTTGIKTTGLGIAAAIIISAGAGIATTQTAEAGKVVKKKVFGIGYAQSRHRAKSRAIKAWTRATRRKYGSKYSNFRNAHKRKIRCEYIGYNERYYNNHRSKRRSNTGVVGNPDAPWTCLAKARPVGYVYNDDSDFYPRHKKMVRGIGYSYTEAGARGLAVRAWTRATRRAYGTAFARYSNAKQKRITCDYIGRGYRNSTRGYKRHSHGGQIIGEAGNVNAPWTCTAKGRPSYSRYYY